MEYEVLAFERLQNNTDIILKKIKSKYFLHLRYGREPVKTETYSNENKAYKAFSKACKRANECAT